MTKKDETPHPEKIDIYSIGPYSKQARDERSLIMVALAERKKQLEDFFQITGDDIFNEYAKGVSAAMRVIRYRDQQLERDRKMNTGE